MAESEKVSAPNTPASPGIPAVPGAAAVPGAVGVSGIPPVPPKRSPGHRGADVKDTVAEMAAKAHEISLEAGSKMAAAMKDVINAAAGLTGFVIESARDLVQYMVRRGQMTQEEADKLIREVEAALPKRKAAAPSHATAKPGAARGPVHAASAGGRVAARPTAKKPTPKAKAAARKPSPKKAASKKSAPKKPAGKKQAPKKPTAKKARPTKGSAKKSGAKKSGAKKSGAKKARHR